jgi:SMC interacting uncharacterized protein involved in chromosome segregation
MNGDAEIYLLKNTVDRHEKKLDELDKQVRAHDLCLVDIPEIKEMVKELVKQTKDLNECKIAQENAEKGKRGVLKDNLWWIKEIFLLVMGAVVIVLWSSAMHLQIGVPK